jgi:glycosyltransferase involved in cell wall biosynthesis
MRIGLDLRMLGGGSGISRYIHELTRQILMQDKANGYVLFFNRLDDATRQEYSQYGHRMVETGISHYSWQEQVLLPGMFSKEKLDLLHVPHFNAPLLYRGKFVVTIHDLTHTRFPGKKFSHSLHRLAYQLVILNAAKRSSKIIAVSESTKSEIMGHYNVPPSKIQVAYEGHKDIYKVMDRDAAWAKISQKFSLERPFLLYVGVWRRYKNLPALAQVFDRLVQEGQDYDLVLAGDQDPHYPEIREQVMGIRNAERIKALGRVSDEDLSYLYNACRLFVLPSLAEGFGLTALEAAACGVPIAASDIPTLREVLGQGAEFFDPENLDNMHDVIKATLENPRRLEELANLALARSKHFSWKQAAEETIKIYESTK